MHNIVNDEFVQALHEDGAEVLVQEVEVAQTEHLFAFEAVPGRHRVKIETAIHLR